MTSFPPLQAYWLGRRPYLALHDLQLALQQQRIDMPAPGLILLLEHDPVITLGRRANAKHVVAPAESLDLRGVSVVETGRGGDVTYHGPGQLVAYPIIALPPGKQDVRKYVRALVDTMKGLANEFGVQGGTLAEHPGFWVDVRSPAEWHGEHEAREPAKMGAVGVRLSHWVSMHGFAFNSRTDLDAFSWIVPCGISEYGVASLQSVGASGPEPSQLAEPAARLLADQLDLPLGSFERIDGVETARLGEVLGL